MEVARATTELKSESSRARVGCCCCPDELREDRRVGLDLREGSQEGQAEKNC